MSKTLVGYETKVAKNESKMNQSNNKHVCSECDKTFTRYFSLRKHVTKNHPSKLDIIAPSRTVRAALNENYAFKCLHCKKNFSYKANLSSHLKTHSFVNNPDSLHVAELKNSLTPRQKCALCDYASRYKKDFKKHYEETHDISVQSSTLEFATADEFTTWKNTLEDTSKSKFVKEKGTTSYGVTTYICHRSGFFMSKGAGKRHLKLQGSNKINGYCPASIKLISHASGKCSVTFVETHIGHQNEIRDSVSSASLEKLYLLTKQDLYNIGASSNLQSAAEKHQNDAVSIEAWIEAVKDHCVIFYKPENSIVAEYPELKSEDFLLIIMNEAQINIFKNYSNDCIWLDSTPGLISYQFKLHTLLVLDDLRQAFPCAFCISSRSDETVIRIFFECIKKKVGLVQANVFISDVSEMYYNAWLKVMQEAQFRLYCTWHVDRFWQKNLKLVKNKEKQIVVYESLRTLLQETDEATFELMLQNFSEKYSQDPDTSAFCTYFTNNYIQNKKAWAYCYRLHCRLNTDMHIERLHNIIKYVYMRGKNVKRPDKSICALMNFIKDKLFDRLIVLNKRKLSSKITELQKIHRTSLSLDTKLISRIDNFWQVASSTSNKTVDFYTIYENNTKCNCKLVCSDCESCIHRYSCSCLDSSIQWNMCKHIHAVCIYRKLQSPQKSSDTEKETNNQAIDSDERVMESEAMLEVLAEPVQTKTMKALAEKKQEMLENISSIVQGISNCAELEAMDQVRKSMRATLLAVQESLKNNR